MTIEIKGKEQTLTSKELEELFLSVEWSSGHDPDKLETAMRNYQTVFTAWDGDRLVGLISAMDDGIVSPAAISSMTRHWRRPVFRLKAYQETRQEES